MTRKFEKHGRPGDRTRALSRLWGDFEGSEEALHTRQRASDIECVAEAVIRGGVG